MMALVLGEIADLQKEARIFVIAVIVLLAFFKITFVYMGTGPYDNMATSGPLKGLYDSEEKVVAYQNSLTDMKVVNSPEYNEEYVYLLTNDSWEYLAVDRKAGTFATYLYIWEKEDYLEKI